MAALIAFAAIGLFGAGVTTGILGVVTVASAGRRNTSP
jgi:hypothetical protein